MKLPPSHEKHGASRHAKRTYVSPNVRVFGRVRELTTGGSGVEAEFVVPPDKCGGGNNKSMC